LVAVPAVLETVVLDAVVDDGAGEPLVAAGGGLDGVVGVVPAGGAVVADWLTDDPPLAGVLSESDVLDPSDEGPAGPADVAAVSWAVVAAPMTWAAVLDPDAVDDDAGPESAGPAGSARLVPGSAADRSVPAAAGVSGVGDRPDVVPSADVPGRSLVTDRCSPDDVPVGRPSWAGSTVTTRLITRASTAAMPIPAAHRKIQAVSGALTWRGS
jgi:hypothetical protein